MTRRGGQGALRGPEGDQPRDAGSSGEDLDRAAEGTEREAGEPDDSGDPGDPEDDLGEDPEDPEDLEEELEEDLEDELLGRRPGRKGGLPRAARYRPRDWEEDGSEGERQEPGRKRHKPRRQRPGKF